jgi:hypothetical protein
MSALGHKRTYAVQKGMSALPPIADIRGAKTNVCFVPIADIVNWQPLAKFDYHNTNVPPDISRCRLALRIKFPCRNVSWFTHLLFDRGV